MKWHSIDLAESDDAVVRGEFQKNEVCTTVVRRRIRDYVCLDVYYLHDNYPGSGRPSTADDTFIGYEPKTLNIDTWPRTLSSASFTAASSRCPSRSTRKM